MTNCIILKYAEGLGKRLTHRCWGKTTSFLLFRPTTRSAVAWWRKIYFITQQVILNSDGIVKVFHLKSSADLTLPISVVTLDLNKPSEGGSTFLALDSVVGTNTQSRGPSVEHRLDLGRPDGRGESRCKLFRGRSSVRFLHLAEWSVYLNNVSRFYTGFSPVFSRYNGENGLIGSVRVWECDGKKGLEDYLQRTRSCSRVVPQCKVGFQPFFFELHCLSSEAAFLLGSRQCGRAAGWRNRDQSGARPLPSPAGTHTEGLSRCLHRRKNLIL